MGLVNNVLQKYPNRVFVETGTLHGESVVKALNAGFERVITIEVFEDLYKKAVVKFINDNRVTVVFGSSSQMLYPCIKQIDEPITFWLDAHYSGNGTSFDGVYCPIMEELEAIAKHHIKEHTILVDDRRLFGRNDRKYGIPFPDVKEELIVAKLLEINPNYEISYEDGHIENDVIVAALRK